ncbi:MAG: NAD+ synthase [Elusimicrobia bacterium]|nr:NAD+ synthase [Elusimicrobiota bacterium]
MKIAIAQMNPKVGDIAANAARIEAFARRAQAMGAELTVFPELALTGYPPLDLLEKKDFIDDNLRALKRLAGLKLATALAVGYVDRNPAGGKPLHNCIALLDGGKIAAKRAKSLLPTYDIFDEARYFEPAAENKPVKFRGATIGLTVCEDIWAETALLPSRLLYRNNPVKTMGRAKASVVINISASPFYRGKGQKRRAILAGLAKKLKAHVVYANQAGANDELIFDGNSFALSPAGKITARAAAFAQDLVLVDTAAPARPPAQPPHDETGEVRAALTLGIRDYFHKMGFKKAVLGLSGGIDSAVVAALAADALGPENVTGVLMPSEYTSRQSGDDALRTAANLRIATRTIPIKPIYDSFLGQLGDAARGGTVDLTMQNLQSRSRGSILMALANTNGWLALTTGNKSEIAVGYCTLYGDTAGAIAPIADLFKTEVYRLAAHFNRGGEVIPQAVIDRPPTAELKPGQKDQDDLPPYADLDEIVRLYMEENRTPSAIVRRGFKKDLVLAILRRVEANEYKRKQLPIGLKVTEKSFGYGRKMPIVKALGYIR